MLQASATDSQLLNDFVCGRDHGAFRGLVSRHGPAVLRVCRGVLQDPHEAEDAFQATFLVLVRKAPQIKDPELLGGWLRGVAQRTALRARSRAARRRALERTRAQMSRTEDSTTEIPSDLRKVIGDELDRLPDGYRQAVTLCCVDGLTHEEAAQRLGWPLGTVKTRLHRGRRLLRERLDRRGAGLSAAIVFWMRKPEESAVSQTLADSTVRAMNLATSGRREALTSQFARAAEIAELTGRRAGVLDARRLWPVVALTALLILLTGSAVLALTGPPPPELDPSTLPSNLTNVLTVDCG